MPHSTTWRPLGALPRVFACGLVVLLGGIRAVSAQQPVNVDKAALEGFYWRGVGPAPFDGRVADVADVPGNPDVMYMGHSSAGLYMSTNRDTTFTSVFDEGNTLSVGARALPGSYSVQLSVARTTQEKPARLPSTVEASQDDLNAYYDAVVRLMRTNGRSGINPPGDAPARRESAPVRRPRIWIADLP